MDAELGTKMERESGNQELSFRSWDVENDQKLGLIDVTQEDDDLLSDSPSFLDLRLSDEGRICNLLKPQLSQRIDNREEKLLQKEVELSPQAPRRALIHKGPDYSRRSLAWDSAFFTNEGVLDDEELTMMINEGFKTSQMQPVTCEDVYAQRFKPGFSKQDDAVSSVPKKVNTSIQSWKSKLGSARGSMNIQRSLKNKTQRLCRREEPHLLSLKAPKVSTPMASVFLGKNKSTSVDAYRAKEARAEPMRSVDSLKLRKKSLLEKSCRISSASLSEFSSPVFSTGSTQALSLSNDLSCISPATSSVASCSGPRSMAMEVHPYGSVSLRRTTSSHNEAVGSPSLMNNLQVKSLSSCPQEEAISPVELDYRGTPDMFLHVHSESRKKLKPSCLRLPSPKIGFFDEGKSVTSSQLLFETLGVSASKNGSTNKKTGKLPRAGLHPVQAIKPGHMRPEGKLSRYSPKVWSSAKKRSDLDLTSQSATCGELGEWICSKCRKTGAGMLDRKRIGRISVLREDDDKRAKGRLKNRLSREIKGKKDDPIPTTPRELPKPAKNAQHRVNNVRPGDKDKRRVLAKFEEQVDDLSKHFELIDLTEDMLIENEDEAYKAENEAEKQKQEAPGRYSNHNPSLSGTEFSASPRTPLSDQTSISNRSGSLKLSAKEKMPGCKSLMQTRTDKENSFPFGI